LGSGAGPTYFDAYLLHGEFIYFVNLESYMLAGSEFQAGPWKKLGTFITINSTGYVVLEK